MADKKKDKATLLKILKRASTCLDKLTEKRGENESRRAKKSQKRHPDYDASVEGIPPKVQKTEYAICDQISESCKLKQLPQLKKYASIKKSILFEEFPPEENITNDNNFITISPLKNGLDGPEHIENYTNEIDELVKPGFPSPSPPTSVSVASDIGQNIAKLHNEILTENEYDLTNGHENVVPMAKLNFNRENNETLVGNEFKETCSRPPIMKSILGNLLEYSRQNSDTNINKPTSVVPYSSPKETNVDNSKPSSFTHLLIPLPQPGDANSYTYRIQTGEKIIQINVPQNLQSTSPNKHNSRVPNKLQLSNSHKQTIVKMPVSNKCEQVASTKSIGDDAHENDLSPQNDVVSKIHIPHLSTVYTKKPEGILSTGISPKTRPQSQSDVKDKVSKQSTVYKIIKRQLPSNPKNKCTTRKISPFPIILTKCKRSKINSLRNVDTTINCHQKRNEVKTQLNDEVNKSQHHPIAMQSRATNVNPTNTTTFGTENIQLMSTPVPVDDTSAPVVHVDDNAIGVPSPAKPVHENDDVVITAVHYKDDSQVELEMEAQFEAQDKKCLPENNKINRKQQELEKHCVVSPEINVNTDDINKIDNSFPNRNELVIKELESCLKHNDKKTHVTHLEMSVSESRIQSVKDNNIAGKHEVPDYASAENSNDNTKDSIKQNATTLELTDLDIDKNQPNCKHSHSVGGTVASRSNDTSNEVSSNLEISQTKTYIDKPVEHLAHTSHQLLAGLPGENIYDTHVSVVTPDSESLINKESCDSMTKKDGYEVDVKDCGDVVFEELSIGDVKNVDNEFYEFLRLSEQPLLSKVDIMGMYTNFEKLKMEDEYVSAVQTDERNPYDLKISDDGGKLLFDAQQAVDITDFYNEIEKMQGKCKEIFLSTDVPSLVLKSTTGFCQFLDFMSRHIKNENTKSFMRPWDMKSFQTECDFFDVRTGHDIKIVERKPNQRVIDSLSMTSMKIDRTADSYISNSVDTLRKCELPEADEANSFTLDSSDQPWTTLSINDDIIEQFTSQLNEPSKSCMQDEVELSAYSFSNTKRNVTAQQKEVLFPNGACEQHDALPTRSYSETTINISSQQKGFVFPAEVTTKVIRLPNNKGTVVLKNFNLRNDWLRMNQCPPINACHWEYFIDKNAYIFRGKDVTCLNMYSDDVLHIGNCKKYNDRKNSFPFSEKFKFRFNGRIIYKRKSHIIHTMKHILLPHLKEMLMEQRNRQNKPMCDNVGRRPDTYLDPFNVNDHNLPTHSKKSDTSMYVYSETPNIHTHFLTAQRNIRAALKDPNDNDLPTIAKPMSFKECTKVCDKQSVITHQQFLPVVASVSASQEQDLPILEKPTTFKEYSQIYARGNVNHETEELMIQKPLGEYENVHTDRLPFIFDEKDEEIENVNNVQKIMKYDFGFGHHGDMFEVGEGDEACSIINPAEITPYDDNDVSSVIPYGLNSESNTAYEYQDESKFEEMFGDYVQRKITTPFNTYSQEEGDYATFTSVENVKPLKATTFFQNDYSNVHNTGDVASCCFECMPVSGKEIDDTIEDKEYNSELVELQINQTTNIIDNKTIARQEDKIVKKEHNMHLEFQPNTAVETDTTGGTFLNVSGSSISKQSYTQHLPGCYENMNPLHETHQVQIPVKFENVETDICFDMQSYSTRSTCVCKDCCDNNNFRTNHASPPSTKVFDLLSYYQTSTPDHTATYLTDETF